MKRRRHSAESRPSRKIDTTQSAAAARSVSAPKAFDGDLSWLLGGGLLAGVALLWAFWPTITDMVHQWVHQPDYSHGFLVLPIAVFFLISRRSQISKDEIAPAISGVWLLLLAAMLRCTAGAFYLQPLDGWTIPLWIAGSVWMLFGWRVLRWSLPSIAFLWFMVPIPFSVERWLSNPLQSIATKLSTAGLLLLGQPAMAEGNTIWIGDHQMFVEEACSGLRIFVGIFALAFAFVLFSQWSWWQKGLALAAALPIAILANVVRIVATGLLFELISSDAAKHFSHDLSGLVVIPLAAGMFWVFLIYLDHLFPQVEVMSVVEVGIPTSALNTTSLSE